ncbi:MAG: hypothetical protein AB7S81_03265 [Bdellovibrionales bacterium]
MADDFQRQLNKVFALVESDHEGEALGAMRMLRRLLDKEGLNLSDLARAAQKGSFSLSKAFFSPAQVQLEAKIEQLQEDLQAHAEQNENLTTQIEFWRRRSYEVEQLLNVQKAEAERWREMARETAEKLWEVGKLAQAEAFLAQNPLLEDEAAEDETEIVKMKEAG